VIRKRIVVATVFVLAFAAAGAARAQCPVPDGLDGGGCYAPATATIPAFNGIEQSSLAICWRSCTLDSTSEIRARWGRFRPAQRPPIPPLCSVFVSRLDILDAAGSAAWSGAMRVWYSRTWFESSNEGRDLQVRRYLVNGDLTALVAAPGLACGVPVCAASFANKIHVSGYIDVAAFCGSGLTFIAWALNHDCDMISHVAGYPRGGSFHGTLSWTFVGPAAGFVPSTGVAPEVGASASEAFRPLDLAPKVTGMPPSGDICLFEERLDNAAIPAGTAFCPCPDATFENQYVQSTLDALSNCSSSIVSGVGGFPDGFISKSIGAWTDGSLFPGEESLRINFGGYRTVEPNRPRDAFQVFYGVTTAGGFAARSVTAGGVGDELGRVFVDQGNALRYPSFDPVLNFKYVSDVILNLNF